jgi:hypothetical protein
MSPPDELVPVDAGAGLEVGGAVGGMRTIGTGTGEGTATVMNAASASSTAVALTVDAAVAAGDDTAVEAAVEAAVEVAVGDADAAFATDVEDDANAADTDPRSRANAKESTRGRPFCGTGCKAVSPMRPITAMPVRATPHIRKRPRVIRRRTKCNLLLLVSRATPGSIARSRAGDNTPGLQFHREQGTVGREPVRDLAPTVALLWTWTIRDQGTLPCRRPTAQPS